MRKIIVLIFFMVQVVGIIYSRFVDERFFCWAPFDQISLYEIQVKINSQFLSSQKIRERYNLPSIGRENRSIHNLFDIITQYEESYGKGESASILVTYCTNGKAKEEWRYIGE